MNDDSTEDAFDEYLAQSLRGDASSPEQFLAERTAVAPDVAEAIRGLGPVAARAAPVLRALAAGDAPPFETLGEFRLIERLGRGGQGLVFLAEQPALRRRVALKILRPELWNSPDAAARFEREAHAAAALHHPNIVAVHAIGEDRGVRYIAMELVAGQSLEEALAAGVRAVPLTQRVRWILDVARALDHAHRRGLVHRDVKPSNIRLAEDGRAVLLDFGLVRDVTATTSLASGFAGSPHYASPEQIESRAVDAQSDVYSLGATLYRCATGRVPFEGPTLEGLMQRILVGGPPSPRRVDPSLPRDLELVCLKALERDRARRYASAAQFADDLQALLELRPVRARAPSALGRAIRAARRRPAMAAVVLTTCAALVALGVLTWWRAAAERSRARDEARQLIGAASERIERYRASRLASATLAAQVGMVVRSQQYRYLVREEVELLDRSESDLVRTRRDWEELFWGVLDLVEQAQRQDPRVDGAEAVRGRLYEERMHQAALEEDEDTAELYRELALQHDPDGSRARELGTPASISIRSEPSGAEVYLFRWEDLPRVAIGAELRKVPVPYREQIWATGASEGSAEVRAGTWVLQLAADAGELRRGDLVFELGHAPIEDCVLVARGAGDVRFLDRLVAVGDRSIGALEDLPAAADGEAPLHWTFERAGQRVEVDAGGAAPPSIELATPWQLALRADRPPVACRVWRDGALAAAELPPGAAVKPTAVPYLLSPLSRAGSTPLAALKLPAGLYTAVVRAPGRETARLHFKCAPTLAIELSAELLPEGTTPQGFVHVLPSVTRFSDPVREPESFDPFWIQEREVTCGEWLEFLNDARTLREVAQSREPIRFPRTAATALRGGTWRRASDGRFELGADVRADFPVLGVSWHDAVAYAHWCSERAAQRGELWEFALPTPVQLEIAGTGGLPFFYPWGVRFRAHYARTCFAYPRAAPGPVMQFPIDVSPCGVYDLGGGAFEWLDGWYDAARGLRHQCGGSWARSEPEVLKVTGGIGGLPEVADNEEGLRLIARRRAGSGLGGGR